MERVRKVMHAIQDKCFFSASKRPLILIGKNMGRG